MQGSSPLAPLGSWTRLSHSTASTTERQEIEYHQVPVQGERLMPAGAMESVNQQREICLVRAALVHLRNLVCPFLTLAKLGSQLFQVRRLSASISLMLPVSPH